MIIEKGEGCCAKWRFPAVGQVGEHFLRLARRLHNIDSIENPSGKGNAVGQCGRVNLFSFKNGQNYGTFYGASHFLSLALGCITPHNMQC
ncbi:MAG: hypothetical protein ACLQBD_14100 [Syntrophobacteraceae bacterium]